jgi:hypothetical protein
MPASWQSASQRSGSPTQMEVFGSRNGIMHHLIISQNFLFGLWSEMDTYRHLIFHKLIISSDIIFKKFNSWETPQTPVKRERERHLKRNSAGRTRAEPRQASPARAAAARAAAACHARGSNLLLLVGARSPRPVSCQAAAARGATESLMMSGQWRSNPWLRSWRSDTVMAMTMQPIKRQVDLLRSGRGNQQRCVARL